MEKIEPEYQSVLDYLYSFVDFSLTRQDRLAAANFDLQRMVDLMSLLGNPHFKYPVIHIAGTKGKGSTAAMIASVLQQEGYRIGLYTSPHLIDYCERIQINRKNISHQSLVNLVEKIKPSVEKVEGLTTFEITTALGFLAFAEANIDIAVIEVGLGGRLDATNVVNPLVSVITSLSYDHMNVLGNTLSQIATEKAGIIKEKRPVVLAPQEETPLKVIEGIANERNAPLIRVGNDLLFSSLSHSLEEQSMMIWTKEEQAQMNEYLDSGGQGQWEPLIIHTPLLGYHQVQNTATAYAAILEARKQGIIISDKAILKGFSTVEWPGRFEVLCKDPILIIDSAHNLDSALKLRIAIDDYLSDRSVLLVFGVSEDKDIAGMFSQLMPRAKMVIATQSTHPRACAANKLVELAHQFGRPAITTSDIPSAIEWAIKHVGENEAIVVAGSIFVAAAVKEEWPKLKERINEIRTT
ncbi:MAG: folylpolyglutamate synthase/dihydrofolate synthase family protein [Anaerolineaceae bacterium]